MKLAKINLCILMSKTMVLQMTDKRQTTNFSYAFHFQRNDQGDKRTILAVTIYCKLVSASYFIIVYSNYLRLPKKCAKQMRRDSFKFIQ